MTCDKGMIKLWETGGDAVCFNEDFLLVVGFFAFFIIMCIYTWVDKK